MLLFAKILFFGICAAALVHSYVSPALSGWPKLKQRGRPNEINPDDYGRGGIGGIGRGGGGGDGGFGGLGGGFGGGGAAGGW